MTVDQPENEVSPIDRERRWTLKRRTRFERKVSHVRSVCFLPIFFDSESSLCLFKLDFVVLSTILPPVAFSSTTIGLTGRVLIFFRLLLPFHRQQKIMVIRLKTNANIFAIVEPMFATKSIINGTPNAL